MGMGMLQRMSWVPSNIVQDIDMDMEWSTSNKILYSYWRCTFAMVGAYTDSI